jgi:hypothetical protein
VKLLVSSGGAFTFFPEIWCCNDLALPLVILLVIGQFPSTALMIIMLYPIWLIILVLCEDCAGHNSFWLYALPSVFYGE